MASAHAKRCLSAAVSIPLLAVVILEGGKMGFAFLVGLAATIGLLEYHGLVFPVQAATEKIVGLMLGLAVIVSFYKGGVVVTCGMLPLIFLVSAAMGMARFRPGNAMAEDLSKQVMGYVYVPFLLGHLILIRDWDRGVVWTCFLLAIVFAGDTGAYYVGNAVGRHQLSPGISPGKTVEGAAGGLASNLLVGSVLKHYWLPELPWALCIGLILLLGVLGQAGDLVESMLKRSYGLKDSGRLLPGHGGILDRIDGLLFAAPALYYFKTYLL